MLHLPSLFTAVILAFAPLFAQQRTWCHAEALLVGAMRLGPQARLAVATAAWYRKARPTFADTLAAVRRHVWANQGFFTSSHAPEATKLPPDLGEGIAYALCHAA